MYRLVFRMPKNRHRCNKKTNEISTPLINDNDNDNDVEYEMISNDLTPTEFIKQQLGDTEHIAGPVDMNYYPEMDNNEKTTKRNKKIKHFVEESEPEKTIPDTKQRKKDKKGKKDKKCKKDNAQPVVLIDEDCFVLDPKTRDIVVEKYSLVLGGKTLLDETHLKIVNKKKYGLIGKNGSGKTSLMNDIRSAIEKNHIAMTFYMVNQEIAVSDTTTVFDTLFNSNKPLMELISKNEELEAKINDEYDENLYEEYEQVQQKLREVNPEKEKNVVSRLLYGLGFTDEDQQKPTSAFSGGWRMRLSLASALYLKPDLLFLDEPTNHLDLDATIWLSDYLDTEWNNTLLLVSHNQYFIDKICTDIIDLDMKKLNYYRGNYTKYLVKHEQDIKKTHIDYEKYKKRLKEFKKKNKSKDELSKFIKENEVPKPIKQKLSIIKFPDVAQLKRPILEIKDVSFGYDGTMILDSIEFGIDFDSRVTIVGRNGVGKSTLLKLIAGKLRTFGGEITQNPHLNVGYFHQHSSDSLPLELTGVEYIMKLDSNLEIQDARKYLGTFGLEGDLHNKPIKKLSGGQKSRISLIEVVVGKPDVILLDEPTNHLDIDTIRELINGINNYKGGIVMVTHDSTLINGTNSILWELENKHITEINYRDYEQKILNEL